MTTTSASNSVVYEHPIELLQKLIRFDTTNPPGNEEECIKYIGHLLNEAGIQTTLVGKVSNRPNLIARWAGRGDAPGLLLQGHVDVISTANQIWSHPPFAGEIADGCIWGRGALDMKGGVAMMLAALLRARAESLAPAGDIVFAALADEESFSHYGAKYVVEQHPDLLTGIRYAIGEFGGFTSYFRGRKFYMVMVNEKQNCFVRITFRGRGGHSSIPERGGATAKLGRALVALDRHRLPVHVTATSRLMLKRLAAPLPFPQKLIMRQLINPRLTNKVLSVMGPMREVFDPLFRNTVTPTILSAGEKINVMPTEVTLQIDARLLPGFGPDDLRAELRQLLGEDAEIELTDYNPGPDEPDMGLFALLANILHDMDPEGTTVPFLLPATTDGRFFSRLGIQTYGFTPMKLPPGLEFWRLTHGADERIPIEALEFGTQAIYKLLQRYGKEKNAS